MGAFVFSVSEHETPFPNPHEQIPYTIHNFMTVKEIPTPQNQKRKLSAEAEQVTKAPLQPLPKRVKLKGQSRSQTPSSFWDNLSRQWLTPRTLREFDRRTIQVTAPQPPELPDLRRKDHILLLKRFARHGGPSLDNIRVYPEYHISDHMNGVMSLDQSPPRSQETPAKSSNQPPSKTTRKTSTYDGAFEQHLSDHGISFADYDERPDNWDEINTRLAQEWPSLLPSRPTDVVRAEFEAFVKSNRAALTERMVMSTSFLDIAGSRLIPFQLCLPFGNLRQLTDGSLARPEPDYYNGTNPTELDMRIRKELGPYIVPSTNEKAPYLPNFFTQGKGPSGTSNVCERQALYDGALGARGMHELRTFIDAGTAFDNKAYTITSTYHGPTGDLTLYTVHPTRSKDSRYPIEYRMTQLNGWKITGNPTSYRQGVTALRNAREWAKEIRDGVVKAANAKVEKLPMGTSILDSSQDSDRSLSAN